MQKLPILFDLGRLVITPGAAEVAMRLGLNPFQLLLRHVVGDWGDLKSTEDQIANELALVKGGRIFSVYESQGRVFWVITEADRSYTTILLPDEY